MPRSSENPWLTRFAWLTAGATLVLICIGGLVTSHGAGLSVPDWPNTYGYNMFFFPVSRWVGGVFYEHTHRLAASMVGLLTTVLMVWLWLAEGRSWMRWLGVTAFFGVVFQGVLGGLRVTLFKDEIGIFHAIVAQLFFLLVAAIGLFLTHWWRSQPEPTVPAGLLRRLFLIASGLVLVQLALGAGMRHRHAGLAIPDFPLAYGKLWPSTDPRSIAAYNQNRIEVSAAKDITALDVALQMAHRVGAVLVLLAVCGCAWAARRRLGPRHVLGRWSLAWVGMVILQACLGAATVWTAKSADVATTHVALGAVSLVTGGLLSIISFRVLVRADQREGARKSWEATNSKLAASAG